MKKVIAILVFIGIISSLIAFFIPTDKNQSKNAAKAVLDNVIEQNYEKAFASIYYFDEASDSEPTISYEEAKNRWIKRVKELKEQGVCVVDYRQLHVRLEDTYPVGTVDLILMENGEKVVKKDVYLWFAEREGSWKLGNFDFHNDEKEENWEKALSGNLN